jgi:RsiW-degrading membrane proteinase PrsW (M82 family)
MGYYLPFIEELGRFLSVIAGPPLLIVYTTVFVIIENIVILTDNPVHDHHLQVILIRFIVSGIHFFLLGIQYNWFLRYKKTNDKSKLFIGFLIAYAVHVSWNAVLSDRVYEILLLL